MATANVSGDEKENDFTTYEQLYCAPDVNTGIHSQLRFISVLNSFLSITAFLGNALMLVALRKDSSLHPPSKLFLSNLATTDLCVGLISEPLAVTLLVTAVKENWNICGYVYAAAFTTSSILCMVSLLTLTAISVDRLLALLLGLRYSQVVTLKRAYRIIITSWGVSTMVATIRLFWNPSFFSRYNVTVASLCLIISTFCYTKIFFTFRHHENRVQALVPQPNQANQLNIARHRKAVSSALWLQFILVVCFLPHVISLIFLFHAGPSSSVSLSISYTITLIYFNSSLNPILYCWKIDEVRQSVKDTIRQVLCCRSRQLLQN